MSAVQTKPKSPMHHSGSPARGSARGGGAASKFETPALETAGLAAQSPLGAFYSSGPALSLGALGGAAASNNRSGGRLLHSGGSPAHALQFKLTMGHAGDPFEREADVTAGRVARGDTAPAISSLGPGALTGMATLQPQTGTEEEKEEESAEESALQPCACEQQGSIESPRVQRETETAEAEKEPPVEAEKEPEEMPSQPFLIQRETEAVEEEQEPPTAAEEEPEETPSQPFLIQREVETAEAEKEPPAEAEEEPEEIASQPLLIQRQAEEEQEEEAAEAPDEMEVQTKCAECEAEEKIQAKTTFPPLPDASTAPAEAGPESGQKEEAAPEEEDAKDKEGKDKEGKEAGAKEKVNLPDLEPLPEKEITLPVQTQGLPASNSHARAPSPAASRHGNALQDSLRSSKGQGAPLAPTVQAEMEEHFNKDLGQVRVHTDSNAAQMNKKLGARAFTNEKDIYFNANEYTPSSQSGKYLLAHELTHTVQQGAVNDTVQRFSAPAQDVAVDPKPSRPDDGGEVTGRMNQKIADDENVQNQDDLSDEEREEKKKPDRGEVRQESSTISSSGEASPSVDRGALAEEKTTTQKEQLQQELDQQPAESTEGGEEGGEEESVPLTPAQSAAQRAQAAQAQANSVAIPAEPQPVRHPRIEAPVDSAGEPLPRNSQIDTQVRGLGYIAEMLRTKGYEMKRHSARQEIASFGLQSVVEREREDLARAREGTSAMESHNEARAEIAEQSKQAHTESVERQQFVASHAPDLASKADEGGADSGELAAEAGDKAGQSQSEIPDDEDARADAEQQSGEMQETAQGAASMDQAIRQSGERARQYGADAEAAAQQNEQAETGITETDELITQTQARVTEMQAKNEASQAQIDEASSGPALIRQFAQRDAQSGDELIAATIVMEDELNALQEEYLSDMSKIESREEAIERQKKEQEESGNDELSPEERQLVELAGMDEAEQEQHVAGMSQTQRTGMLATLERMIKTTPDEGADEAEGARLKVDTGLAKAISGEPPPDPRAEQIQEVENRRIQRVGGALDVADRNMSFLTEEQQRMLANRLVSESITDDIKNINVLQMGEAMLKGMIDPRQSLVGVVGGFEKMLTGFANIGNWDAWKKDPLGNLLQIAADITTGLATIFSSILGLAALVTAVMVALTILSWGFLSPITGPVIGWMGVVMTYAGWGAIITGGLAVYFNYLAYLKNLHDAGTAQTARELFGNTEQMKKNASDGFQGAMAVVEGIGAVKMGPKLSSGEFFSQVPRSPGAFARQTAQGVKRGAASLASAPGRIGRGIRQLFAGGKQGLIRFKERLQGLFGRRRPARTGDVDLPDTPQAHQRHQSDLNDARGKRAKDMDRAELAAEVRDAGKSQPKRVDPTSEHFADYDVEVQANGHTYRRRRDGRGWCRFSAEECFVNLPPSTRRALGVDDDFGDSLFGEYLIDDPDLARGRTRRTRAEPSGPQAQREAINDIRRSGEVPDAALRAGVDPNRQIYLGKTPGRGSKTGKAVIDRMRAEVPSRIRGFGNNTEVFVVGPDGVKRWYPLSETDMGHIHDAVRYWNTTGRHFGPRHPQVRKWMRDPANYELEHSVVNQRKGSLLGQTDQYLPPTR